jgi:hypothetical protein
LNSISEGEKMTQALLAAIFAMTLDDPVEASRFWVIGWQVAFEAFALPTTMAVFSLVLQGPSREARASAPVIRGFFEVPWEIETTSREGAPRVGVQANTERDFAETPSG